MINLYSILKTKTLLCDKSPYSQSYGFCRRHVWIWVLDYKGSWVLRTEVFELWCRRLLRVPWTARRSNQSILKEISPEYSLELLMWSSNTLATWWEEHLFIRKDPGKDWRQEEKGTTEDEIVGWHHRLNGHEFDGCSPPNSGSWWYTGKPGMLQSLGSQRVGHDWTPELNWTERLYIVVYYLPKDFLEGRYGFPKTTGENKCKCLCCYLSEGYIFLKWELD